jgi:quaternary ammonium compound-resistance protein SugE
LAIIARHLTFSVMAWVYLFLAAMCEMCWPLGFNLTQGFTNWSKNWPLIFGTFAIMLASFALMSLASRNLPVGTVYAVWTGLGTTGIVLIGMIFMKEPRDIGRFVCLALIIVGVVGLRCLEKPIPTPPSMANKSGER